MKKIRFFILGLLLLIRAMPLHAELSYKRIISLAPSITEIVFELGLEEQLVGVTRYCDYPPAATSIQNVGGYLDPNYEAMLSLKPDLIIMLPEHKGLEKNLKGLKYEMLEVNNKCIDQILASIRAIGNKCGAGEKSKQVVKKLKKRMSHVSEKAQDLQYKPRVLITVGRNMGSGTIDDVYVAGRSTFYEEMVMLAGGQNAYQGKVSFPTMSAEGIIRMNPDVIIDVIPDLEAKKWSREQVLAEWKSLFGINALNNNNIHIFGQEYTVIPGPRFILILEDIMRAIHSSL